MTGPRSFTVGQLVGVRHLGHVDVAQVVHVREDGFLDLEVSTRRGRVWKLLKADDPNVITPPPADFGRMDA